MGSCVSGLYQREWYDGINEEDDVLVKVFHPIDPSVYLHWPLIEVKCWVPVNHGLQLLSIPTANTSGGPYTFLKSKLKKLQKKFPGNLQTVNIVFCTYQ